MLCVNTCNYASDGDCDDGGSGSEYESIAPTKAADRVCNAVTKCPHPGFRQTSAATATTPLDMIKTRLQTQQLKAVASGRGSVPQLSHHHGGGGLGFLGQQTRKVMTVSATNSELGAALAAASAESAVPPRITGALDAARLIYREAGVLGFMRGMVPRLLVSTPSVAISWTTYEMAKGFLRDRI